MDKKLDQVTTDDIIETPKNKYLMATITDVHVGTQAELFNLEDDEQPKYGDRDDERIQINAELEYKDTTLTVVDSMNFPDNITDRHTIGQFIKTYGQPPEEDLQIAVYFDGQGRSEVLTSPEDVEKAR